KEPFLHELVSTVRELMDRAYPELGASEKSIAKVVLAEERQFGRTVEVASVKLDSLIISATKAATTTSPILSGADVFKLYDTYGLPADFIDDVTRDLGVQVDWNRFDTELELQRALSRASWKGGAGKEAANPAFAKIADTFKTEPDFYFATNAKDARIE